MAALMEKVKTAVTGVTGQPATPGGYKGEEMEAQKEKEALYRSEAHVFKTPIDLNHNLAIVLTGNNTVEVKDIGPVKMKNDHEVIIRVATSAICGSDLHMYHFRTSAGAGTVLGHEITGEIVQCGPAVKFLSPGDFVIVPFNVCCGFCSSCKQQKFNCCLNTNPIQPGGMHGYCDGGGYDGGQAQFKIVPFADFNLVKVPDKHRACEEILDIALLTDVLPTGLNAAVEGGVGIGSIVFIAGAGPVGLSAIASSFLLGASIVICGDVRAERLENAKKMGAYTIDLSTLQHEQALVEMESILSNCKIGQLKRVDVAIDCVGYECSPIGAVAGKSNDPACVINFCIDALKYGGTLSIPGVYFPTDPKGPSMGSKMGKYELDFGKLWVKMLTVKTGQCPCLKYEESLLRMILAGRLDIAKYLNIKVISLEQAPEAYKSFNEGEPCKYVVVPHDEVRNQVLQRLTECMKQQPSISMGKGESPLKPSEFASMHGHPAGQIPKAAATTTKNMAEKESGTISGMGAGKTSGGKTKGKE